MKILLWFLNPASANLSTSYDVPTRFPDGLWRNSYSQVGDRKSHVSDKVDNWRRKSDATETGNIATKKNVDGSVFAESSFGKSRASTESSNNSRKNSMSADGKKKTSIEATSKKPANTVCKDNSNIDSDETRIIRSAVRTAEAFSQIRPVCAANDDDAKNGQCEGRRGREKRELRRR